MTEQIRERMTAQEFLQLPESMQKQELIAGELIVSPSPILDHQRLVFRFAKLLEKFIPNGEVIISPMDVEFDEDNVFQPDVLWISEQRASIKQDGYIVGAPDLIVEVLSPGTARFDKREKFKAYEKHGVREYWLAEPQGAYLEVWILDDGKFTRLGVFANNDKFESKALGKDVQLEGIF